MINLPSLVQRQKPALAVLLSASLFYSGSLMAESVKVAFTGDQGAGEGARAVLSLIANEGTDLLLLQGDLGYKDGTASIWEENLTQALGADFPVLTVVGNHENFEWPLYKRFIQQRIDRVDGLSCSGDTGVKALCRYKNIEVVQVSPGIHEVDGVNGDENYADFIASSFAESTAPWKICAWHKNQSRMQTGSKSDATGWGVYDACLNVGAMVALAHEHAYSRTYLFSDFRNQTIANKSSDMTLEPGRSFAFVSGLGGHEVRDQAQGGDWWASIYTGTQGATHGALFCTFEDTTADCYFKAIDGAVPDQFTLRNTSGSSSARSTVVASSEPVNSQPAAEERAPEAVAPEATAAAEPEMLPSQPESAEADLVEQPVQDTGTDLPDSLESEPVVIANPDSEPTPSASSEGAAAPIAVTQSETSVPETGPLTVVSNEGSSTEDAAPAAQTEVSAIAKESGGSAGGSGSFSLFMLLALMAQFWFRRVRFTKIA